MLRDRRIAVIGGGVIGLSVATRLLEHRAAVTVYSPQPLDRLTSFVAAAYWAPYWVGEYNRSLASTTLIELQRLAAEPSAGIAEFPFEEWLTEAGAKELAGELDTAYWWRHLGGIDFAWEPLTESKSFAWKGQTWEFEQRVRFKSVVARMPDYLGWLESRLRRSTQVQFNEAWVDSLADITPEFDHVVNCTGWGAKTLVKDDADTDAMRLLAGHVVIVDAPEIDTAVSLHRSPFRDAPVYIVPRHGSRHDVLCGGTAIEVTVPLDPREPLTFRRDELCDDVIERVSQVLPSMRGRTQLSCGVGLRPVRRSVRIERDAQQSKLVHCYGHGGSGLTLSWGSADRVIEILAE